MCREGVCNNDNNNNNNANSSTNIILLALHIDMWVQCMSLCWLTFLHELYYCAALLFMYKLSITFDIIEYHVIIVRSIVRRTLLH